MASSLAARARACGRSAPCCHRGRPAHQLRDGEPMAEGSCPPRIAPTSSRRRGRGRRRCAPQFRRLRTRRRARSGGGRRATIYPVDLRPALQERARRASPSSRAAAASRRARARRRLDGEGASGARRRPLPRSSRPASSCAARPVKPVFMSAGPLAAPAARRTPRTPRTPRAAAGTLTATRCRRDAGAARAAADSAAHSGPGAGAALLVPRSCGSTSRSVF